MNDPHVVYVLCEGQFGNMADYLIPVPIGIAVFEEKEAK